MEDQTRGETLGKLSYGALSWNRGIDVDLMGGNGSTQRVGVNWRG